MTLLKTVHEVHHVRAEKIVVTKPGVIEHFEGSEAELDAMKAHGAVVDPTDDELKLHALANPEPEPAPAAVGDKKGGKGAGAKEDGI